MGGLNLSGIGRGRGRPRTTPAVLSPLRGALRVQADGTLTTAAGARRRYRCFPDGGRRHSFTVPVVPPAPDTDAARAWSPPPRCDQHREEPHQVIRDDDGVRSHEGTLSALNGKGQRLGTGPGPVLGGRGALRCGGALVHRLQGS